SVARKNPLMAVRAFRLAFGDDVKARLIVKASNTSAVPGLLSALTEARGSSQNISIVDRVISAAEVQSLYHETDVVLSLHRSEGFGLTIAEGMLRGLPAVATDWSGNVDFLTRETGFPVPYQLVPAE